MTQQQRSDRANRLNKFINHLEIKYVTFAKKVGMKSSYVSNLITQVRPVSETVAQQIIAVYPRLNIQWLLWGTGEMLSDKKPAELEVINEAGTQYRATREGEEPGHLATICEPAAAAALAKNSEVDRHAENSDAGSKRPFSQPSPLSPSR